jgi:hypothetical protein
LLFLADGISSVAGAPDSCDACSPAACDVDDDVDEDDPPE